ncbi:MAG: FAD-dependent monooxygenase [Myxococcaceae bacterium]|jgi:2-polyprenyl-6-methoxyphenol hydroxylase-like FAD-dependent oxidoreductase|nr:FAD-dependent monooxygenase [Myxococcaceae bacterium]
MKALVVGAGPAGLATALRLRRGGADVVLVERQSMERLFADAGGAYELSTRSLEVLESLGAAELVRARATVLTHFVLRGPKDAPLQSLDLERAGLPVVSITRAELQRSLWAVLEPLGVTLITGAQVSGVVQDDDGVSLMVNEGVQRADVLVAADGVHSVIRRACFSTEPAREVGLAAWWGRTRIDTAFRLEQGHSFGVMVPQCSFVTTRAVSGDELLWTVCELAEPSRKQPRLDGLPADVRRVVEGAHFTARTRLLEQVPLARWVDRRVCLVGDAAHGMTPFLGLGANSALEDAVLTADTLLAHGPGSPELTVLLDRRARQLNPRIAEARRLGRLMHAKPWLHALFRLVTRLVPASVVLWQLKARHQRLVSP